MRVGSRQIRNRLFRFPGESVGHGSTSVTGRVPAANRLIPKGICRCHAMRRWTPNDSFADAVSQADVKPGSVLRLQEMVRSTSTMAAAGAATWAAETVSRGAFRNVLWRARWLGACGHGDGSGNTARSRYLLDRIYRKRTFSCQEPRRRETFEALPLRHYPVPHRPLRSRNGLKEGVFIRFYGS